MEGHDLVEAVAVTEFAVDGDDATAFLAEWVGGLRQRPTVQGVVLGGITIRRARGRGPPTVAPG